MSERLPILTPGEVLLVSIQTDLDDQSVLTLQDDDPAAPPESGSALR
jgi:rsbT antagonist protein RsbS